MNRILAIAAVGLVSLGLSHSAAHAGYGPPDFMRQVDSYYRHYLGRCIDGPSAQNWHCLLLSGQATVPGIEVYVLATDEYYHRQGCTPVGFIVGMYRDVLGQQPDPRMMGYWLERMRCGCRNTVAQEFLAYYRTPPAPAPAPAPVSSFRPREVPVPVEPAAVPVAPYPPQMPYAPVNRTGFRFSVKF